MKKYLKYIPALVVGVIVIIIFIMDIISNNKVYSEQNYYLKITNDFMKAINEPLTAANYEFRGYQLTLPYATKIYDKSNNSFSFYLNEDKISLMILPENADVENFHQEYLANIELKYELVVSETYNNQGESSFIYIYKSDNNYVVNIGEDNTIASFETSYEKLYTQTMAVSEIINSVR